MQKLCPFKKDDYIFILKGRHAGRYGVIHKPFGSGAVVRVFDRFETTASGAFHTTSFGFATINTWNMRAPDPAQLALLMSRFDESQQVDDLYNEGALEAFKKETGL